jgi:hypothetical protein
MIEALTGGLTPRQPHFERSARFRGIQQDMG